MYDVLNTKFHRSTHRSVGLGQAHPNNVIYFHRQSDWCNMLMHCPSESIGTLIFDKTAIFGLEMRLKYMWPWTFNLRTIVKSKAELC